MGETIVDKTYKVVAPLVIAKNGEGSDLYVYQDGLVPAGQTETWVADHVRDGMIAETDAPASVDVEVDAGEKPPANASKDAWVAYAVSQGVDQSDAEALSRNELAALYE